MEQAAATDWLSVGVFAAFTVMVLVLSSLLGGARRAPAGTSPRTGRWDGS